VATVKDILKELSAHEKPVLYALNKADRLVETEKEARALPHPAFVEGKAVVVSAEKGWGLKELLEGLLELGEEVQRSSETLKRE